MTDDDTPILGKYDVCDVCGPTTTNVVRVDADGNPTSADDPNQLLVCEGCLDGFPENMEGNR
jgi:hypothetical protein